MRRRRADLRELGVPYLPPGAFYRVRRDPIDYVVIVEVRESRRWGLGSRLLGSGWASLDRWGPHGALRAAVNAAHARAEEALAPSWAAREVSRYLGDHGRR